MITKKKGRKPTNIAAFEKVKKAGKKQIIIKKKEWNLVTPPGAHILRKYLKAEYKVATLADDTGWLIKKV